MVVTNEGLQKIRDLLNTNLINGQCGTGTTTATENDIGLDVAVGATLKSLTKNTSGNLITATFTLLTTDANGISLTEFDNQFSSGESLIRIRHTPITKDNTKELNFVVTYELSGN